MGVSVARLQTLSTMNSFSVKSTSRMFMVLGLLSTLLGCGDGKPGLFSSNGYHIGMDKVWYKTSTGTWYDVTEVFDADPKTFVVRTLKSSVYPGSSADYGMDQKSVFWASRKIEGADLGSFEYLCSDYCKDKHAVYYMTQVLTDDLAHFEVISRDFVKDSKAVYFGNDVFSEDPAHFSWVGEENSGYFKDSNKCWYGIYELKNADPATIRYLGINTAADAKRIFHEMNEVEGAEIATYQILDADYSKDARQVYFQGQAFGLADPATFRVIGNNYSADHKHCYYYTSPLSNADPATFLIIEEGYTKDARQVFINGTPIEGADPATFRILNAAAGCSCDDKHAYAMDQPIKGVDPRSFPASGACKSCDESTVKF